MLAPIQENQSPPTALSWSILIGGVMRLMRLNAIFDAALHLTNKS